jgi:chromosome segregation ATPase
MELDQVLKKIDWLDEERRKDKSTISALQERVQSVEGMIELSNQQIKSLNSEVTRLTTILSRLDQYDEAILQIRVENKRRLDDLEKQIRKSIEESEKVRRVEMRAMDADMAEVRKELEPISELKRNLQTRIDSELRLDRGLEELRLRIDEVQRSGEEHTRTYRLIDESRRQDSKRMNDVQGELTAIRKRVDEHKAQIELQGNGLRKVESRINELVSFETERKELQTSFLEQQTLWQVERDRAWKEWVARFATIEKQAVDVETQLQTIESTHQLVRRSQETLGNLAERVERRINEITEIQRLGEERFRQEWITFKADDQKRWTNYTLSLDEQRSELLRQNEKLVEQITSLEDQFQENQDLLRQINEQTEKRLQSLLAVAHEWVTSYERAVGQMK